jgi:glyoxylase-like metal-dependent hydrolase (beta-lactamase superfamily II)
MPEPAVVPINLASGGPRGLFAYLVRAGRPIIVDAGTPGNAPRILEALSAEGIDPHDVALILITHGHTDHTGSAADLKEATGAPVAIQALDAPALEAGDSMPVVGRTPAAQRLVEQMAAGRAERLLAMKPLTPDIVVDEERSLADLGIAARLIHTPGHTPGGLTLLLDSGEAIVGDLIATGPEGRADLPYFADDVPALEDSIRRVIEAAPTIVYAGHEGPFTLEQLREAFA